MRVFLLLLSALLGVLLIVAACGDDEEGATEATTAPAAGNPSLGTQELEIAMIPTIRFDKDELRVPADQQVTINVDNRDTGILHNFAVYESEEDANAGEDALFATEICDGPCQDTLTVKIDGGPHFFRCDVHPDEMTGQIIGE
ncbi:MAG TPA: hypothetical protein VMR52_04385 [Dehalococcoidia bacterium]|nr:hypothetical protein [Dehalococcoidia bacterium]